MVTRQYQNKVGSLQGQSESNNDSMEVVWPAFVKCYLGVYGVGKVPKQNLL